MVTGSIGLAMLLAAQPAAAPVTVEIVAIGHSETPATRFVLPVEVTATADTEDKAKAEVARIKAALVQQLAAIGVTPVPEDAGGASSKFSVPNLGVAEIDDKTHKPQSSDSFGMVGGSRSAIDRAKAIIAQTTGVSANQSPTTAITDTAAAARAAKRDAIAKARLDAQTYAEALGYADATVVSVSERGDFGTVFSYAMQSFGASLGGRMRPNMFGASHGDTVPMDVAVTVMFRLDGRK
ncbi:MAG: SIMPL domain-containing protein [Sphingomonas sp.]|uniref:SIMPL domain-containing protein n=1 Tax=Sphingomonas sp. TaxID=28214 RepID=UPI001AD4B657|nr:SIMPL domain-containing protein [Sphingomonas sp.]MBN8807351.1 SIMPL domain-containing protein [Sphingomonas sp.]